MTYKVHTWQDLKGKWAWEVQSESGRPIITGERTYPTQEEALQAGMLVASHMPVLN